MHLILFINWYQYGGDTCNVYQHQYAGSGGGVYDLNIESKINLAGNAKIKIYVIDLLEILVNVTKM